MLFWSLARARYLSLFLLSVVCRNGKVNSSAGSLLIIDYFMCFTPYILDSPSSINTRQWERQSGVHQTALIFSGVALCSVVEHSRPGVVCVLHDSFGCIPPLDTTPLASGRRPPPGFKSLRRVGFIARRLRRPEKRNANGARGIFGTACCVGLWPCDRTHPKTAFCYILMLVGRRINTVHQSAWHNHVWYH